MRILLNITVPKESMSTEYKAFTVDNPDEYFESETMVQIFEGVFTDETKLLFNQMILNNIERYCKKYLPRYSSIFGNSDLPSSQLYFGIDDFGTISGIPFFGSKEAICYQIKESLTDMLPWLKVDSGDVSELVDQIRFEVMECKVDLMYVDDMSKEIEQMVLVETESKAKWADYLFRKNKWLSDIALYNTSIREYANNPKLQSLTIAFIQSHTPNQSLTIPLNTLRQRMIDEIQNNIFEVNIHTIDANVTNPMCVEYWLSQCKEYYVEQIHQQRPPKMLNPVYHKSVYQREIELMFNLQYPWIKHNKDLKYYIIQFQLPTQWKERVWFRQYHSTRWCHKKRIWLEDGPGAI